MIKKNEIDPVLELYCDDCGKLIDYKAISAKEPNWGCGYAQCYSCSTKKYTAHMGDML